jgi:hypothetical protein
VEVQPRGILRRGVRVVNAPQLRTRLALRGSGRRRGVREQFFGLAGLGCSALLPLIIGFAQEELATIAAAAVGGIIAFYQVGYGIAAFGVGPLLDAGVTLPAVYAAAAGIAVAMGCCPSG